MKWLAVIGFGVALLLLGSSGKFLWVDRPSVLSDETRATSATALAPEYTRSEAIALIVEFLRTECEFGFRYIPNSDRFEANFVSTPRTNDHFERPDREWTVVDPLSGGIWRLYETTKGIRTVRGSC